MSKLEIRRIISKFVELADVSVSNPLLGDRPLVSRSSTIQEGSILDTVGNLVLCPNAEPVQVFGYDLLANFNDLYQVPSGKKAMVTTWSVNNQGTSSDVYIALKRGGNYYRVSVLRTVGNLQGINDNSASFCFVFEAGDYISIFSTNSNMNVKLAVVKFDDTTVLKSVVKTDLQTGNNTVYTCPIGKRMRFGGGNGGNQWIVNIIGFWPNDTGNTRTIKQYFVPSGDTIRAQNQFVQSSGSIINLTNTVSAKANSGTIFTQFEAGDSWVLNLDSAPAGGQFAYITGFEY